jgi:hypothetical protein
MHLPLLTLKQTLIITTTKTTVVTVARNRISFNIKQIIIPESFHVVHGIKKKIK